MEIKEKREFKFNLQLFAEGEKKSAEQKNDNNSAENKDTDSLAEMKAMIEALKKQNDIQSKMIEDAKKAKEMADVEAKKAIEAERLKHLSEEDRRKEEEEIRKRENLERETKRLEEEQQRIKELEELKKQNVKTAFENRKLQESIKHPYLKDKINACSSEEEINFLFKITDIKAEEARYKSEQNANGSILNLVKGKSVEADRELDDPMEIIKKRVKDKEKEILEKRKARGEI